MNYLYYLFLAFIFIFLYIIAVVRANMREFIRYKQMRNSGKC